MYNFNNELGSMIFHNLKSIDCGELQIDRPDDLPLEVGTKLDQYNDAIGRLDLENAEKAADEILAWLHRCGTSGT